MSVMLIAAVTLTNWVWKSRAMASTTKTRRKKSKASEGRAEQAGKERRPLLAVERTQFRDEVHVRADI